LRVSIHHFRGCSTLRLGHLIGADNGANRSAYLYGRSMLRPYVLLFARGWFSAEATWNRLSIFDRFSLSGAGPLTRPGQRVYMIVWLLYDGLWPCQAMNPAKHRDWSACRQTKKAISRHFTYRNIKNVLKLTISNKSHLYGCYLI